jgi:hypothetical protein
VLGLEHEIDGIHNYDDGDLKSKIEGSVEKIEVLKIISFLM